MLEYGEPTPVSNKDSKWLSKLNDKIWNRTEDRYGAVHSFPNYERPLSPEELHIILRMIVEHRLPCVLHSGPYGNLSMSIYDHSEAMGVKPDYLFSLDEFHFGYKSSSYKDWKAIYHRLVVYTHNDLNKKMLAFYGLPESKAMSHYEY